MPTYTFSEKDLLDEVRSIVNAHTHRLETNAIVGEIMSRHSSIEGADADFYILCAFDHVKDAIRIVVSEHAKGSKEKLDPQFILPGYERLQRKYHIEHNGKSFLVPIEEITKEEMRDKIKEQERLIDGWQIHVAEMRRYFYQRWNEHV